MSVNFSEDLALIREKKPLVHNITNYVVMNYTANVLLSVGASPVMAHANEEVEDMANIASSLVINMGTLSPSWVEAMIKAGKKANERGIAVVFDPVGSGATVYRTETAKRIINEVKISVLRGNASEIISLIDADAKTRGVDSAHEVQDAKQVARDFAKEKDIVVAITGKIDFVTDGEKDVEIEGGHVLMGKITGTGCSATAIIAAFCAVNDDCLEASVNALDYFGKCGEKAAKKADAPGSYSIALIDALYEM